MFSGNAQSVHDRFQNLYVNNLILNVSKGLRCPNYLLCILPITGSGWASVLKTQWSNGIRLSSENIKYKYFRVSAKKKLCWTSSCETDVVPTSLIPQYPAPTRQYFSMF